MTPPPQIPPAREAAPHHRNVFLHFVNRDARDVYGLNSSCTDQQAVRWVCDNALLAVLLAEEYAFLPPGFPLEDDVASYAIKTLRPLIANKRIRFAIRESDPAEYVSKKHTEYGAQPDRYARLISHKSLDELTALEPTWVIRSARVGDTIASDWRHAFLSSECGSSIGFTDTASLPATSVVRIAAIPADILSLKRAVIWPEILARLQVDIGSNSAVDLRSTLHYFYFRVYVEEYGAAVLSGLRVPRERFGIPRVDGLHYDVQCFRQVLGLLGLDPRQALTPAVAADIRETPEFAAFMLAYRRSITRAEGIVSKSTQIHARAGPQVLVHQAAHVVATWRAATRTHWSANQPTIHGLRTRLQSSAEQVELLLGAPWSAVPRTRRRRRVVVSFRSRGPTRAALIVPGIRTNGEWKTSVATLLREHGIEAYTVDYGWVSVFFFLAPFGWLRDRYRTLVRRQLAAASDRHGRGHVSVVSHSFGTYLVATLMESEGDTEIDHFVMCGAIVQNNFRWHSIAQRVRRRIVNDCGVRDRWPLIAGWWGTGYGCIGATGANDVNVRDRFHDADHSGFLSVDFARRFWIPLLTSEQVVEGIRERPPLGYFWSVPRFLTLKVVLVFVICWGIWRWWATGNIR